MHQWTFWLELLNHNFIRGPRYNLTRGNSFVGNFLFSIGKASDANIVLWKNWDALNFILFRWETHLQKKWNDNLKLIKFHPILGTFCVKNEDRTLDIYWLDIFSRTLIIVLKFPLKLLVYIFVGLNDEIWT